MFRKNERGFTLAESLLSMMTILLLGTVVLPIATQMMVQSQLLWEKQEGMRVLFEEGESQFLKSGELQIHHKEEEGYVIYWESGQGCFSSPDQTFCIKEQ